MNILKFSEVVGKLKRLKRTGWVRNKITDPETVAEHSFRLAILAMIFAPKIGVDQLKAIKMALIHDIGEAEIGDIVTQHGQAPVEKLSEKITKEREAIQTIFSLLDTQEYLIMFNEFEENKTPEAKLVKQLDKLEMGIQAYEYEKQQNKNLEPFFESVRPTIKDVELLNLLDEIETKRNK
jgi:putative hydrolase of HD superfamily